MIKNAECRTMDVRAIEDSQEMILEGYAILFETPATHTYGDRSFTEVIGRGSLDGVDFRDVPLRYNHNDTWMIIARTRNGSLKLTVDERGLKVWAKLLDTQSNRDIYKSIQAELISQMSFAFSVAGGGDEWTRTDGGAYRRINKIERLGDVSVVDTPFYDQTSIYARSFDSLDREMERLDSLDALKLRKRKILMLKGAQV